MPTKTPSFRIVADRHEVYVGTREVKLAPKEWDILALLKANPKTHSREEIIDAIWPDGTIDESRTVDQHVARLRRKMRPVIAVITVATKGYKISNAV